MRPSDDLLLDKKCYNYKLIYENERLKSGPGAVFPTEKIKKIKIRLSLMPENNCNFFTPFKLHLLSPRGNQSLQKNHNITALCFIDLALNRIPSDLIPQCISHFIFCP